jgi:hypothetical protein
MTSVINNEIEALSDAKLVEVAGGLMTRREATGFANVF